MSTNDQTTDSEFSKLMECCICFHTLRESRMCPECYQPFCRECVTRWLFKQSTCPYCRSSMQTNRLVKVHVFQQLIETLQQLLIEETRNQCPAHPKQQLLMACLQCQQCVCVDCWLSDDHVEHKDQIVPMKIAFDHFYHKTMVKSKAISEDTASRDKMALLLLEGKRDAGTLREILEIMEKLRNDDEN